MSLILCWSVFIAHSFWQVWGAVRPLLPNLFRCLVFCFHYSVEHIVSGCRLFTILITMSGVNGQKHFRCSTVNTRTVTQIHHIHQSDANAPKYQHTHRIIDSIYNSHSTAATPRRSFTHSIGRNMRKKSAKQMIWNVAELPAYYPNRTLSPAWYHWAFFCANCSVWVASRFTRCSILWKSRV